MTWAALFQHCRFSGGPAPTAAASVWLAGCPTHSGANRRWPITYAPRRGSAAPRTDPAIRLARPCCLLFKGSGVWSTIIVVVALAARRCDSPINFLKQCLCHWALFRSMAPILCLMAALFDREVLSSHGSPYIKLPALAFFKSSSFRFFSSHHHHIPASEDWIPKTLSLCSST